MTDGAGNITAKQSVVLEELGELGVDGIHPTVRSLADRLETRKRRSERFSDAEIRGLLERLEEHGLVEQFTGQDGSARYRLA